MLNYNDELKRVSQRLWEESKIAFPSMLRVISYFIQVFLCIGAVVAISIYGLLNRLADELDKNKKTVKPGSAKKKNTDTRFNIPVTISSKCEFGIRQRCSPVCRFWTKSFSGGGYCSKMTEKW